MVSIQLFFDGATAPTNPGPSGAGWHIKIYKSKTNEFIQEYKEYKFLGPRMTNNEAEYLALIHGLESIIDIVKKIKSKTDIKLESVIIFGDSALVINQLSGSYKVKAINLIKYYNKAKELISELESRTLSLKIIHILRHKNTIADDMSKLALKNSMYT